MPEFLHDHQFLYYTLILALSTLISLQAIPSILHVARARHLYDDLGHFRKQHDHGIPRLGGIAIFVSFVITLLLFCVTGQQLPLNYILAANIILFAVGLKDDLSGVNPSTKFIIQIVTSAILVVPGHIAIVNMEGVLGVYELSYPVSVIFSMLTIILIINAFNLIDGVDGLAGVTGIIVNGCFAVLFLYMQQYELASVCFALVGALLGFLRYNFPPAKIFMGDTGSLMIGLISVVMAIKFIQIGLLPGNKGRQISAVPALTVAILVGPIFDTLRVFILRVFKKSSPFKADRNHVHHRILQMGFTPLQTTLTLASVDIICIALALIFNKLNNTTLIIIIALVTLAFNWLLTFSLRCKERGKVSLRYLLS